MSSNIHWVAAITPSTAHLYQTSSNEEYQKKKQIIQSLGLGSYIACNPEIEIARLNSRKICIQWPKNNFVIREKIINLLRETGILIREIRGENAEVNNDRISNAVWSLEQKSFLLKELDFLLDINREQSPLTLTEELFNLLTENENKATEIVQAIYILHKDRICLENDFVKILTTNKEKSSGIASGVLILDLAKFPLNDDVLSLLCASKDPISTSKVLKELHLAHFSPTPGDLQLILSKSSSDLHFALSILRENYIPLTREYFLFLMFNSKNAIQISLAIRILYQVNIPLTSEIRQLLNKNAEMIAFVLASLHLAHIPLTEEIYVFLENSGREYFEVEKLTLKNLTETEFDFCSKSPLYKTAAKIHADALFSTIVTFRNVNAPIPEEIPQFLVDNSIYAMISFLSQLHKENVPMTEEVSKLLTIDANVINTAWLHMEEAEIPLTEELFALISELHDACITAMGKTLLYMHKVGIHLTPEIQKFLVEIKRIRISSIIDELQNANIPLPEEVRKLICKTYEARIHAVSREVVDLKISLPMQTREYITSIGTDTSLTRYAIENLLAASISLTPEIYSFLIEANEIQSLALIWESMCRASNGEILDFKMLNKIQNESNYFHFQTPGRVLVYLKKAGIPLTKTTLDSICGNKTYHLGIQCLISLMHEKNMLTQKNFNALVAGGGARMPIIWEKLKGSLSQEKWDRILSEIEEAEWKPCRDAAIVLGQRNRVLTRDGLPGRLPPEIIGQIARYLAPPGMPRYAYKAEDVARKEEERLLQSDL